MKAQSWRRIVAATGIAVTLAGALAACSASSDGDSSDGKVTITIGNQPSADVPADLKNYQDNVASFEKAHPNITLKPTTTSWDPQTFQTTLAGGTLPDVLAVPFTEGRSLAAKGQVADLTDDLKAEGLLDRLNPKTLEIAENSKGRVYGVPISAYSMGLAINRSLFTKAGLDPDDPPTTWDEVRADAKQITERTGVAGFGQLTSNNSGGWLLTAETYSYGGRIVDDAGDTATFTDGDATKNVLQMLHAMKFDDGSMGSNALYDNAAGAAAFTAGKFAMIVLAPDLYNFVVVNGKFPKDSFGFGPMPQAGSSASGTLTGGALQVVSPKANAAERRAAVQWIEWFSLRQYTDQSQAVATAKASAASGSAVGLPSLSVLDGDAYSDYLGWVKPYVNVPTQQFAAYTAALPNIPIIAEPPKNAQAVYADLDPVVQAVLTRQDADIDSLLSQAAKTVDSTLSR